MKCQSVDQRVQADGFDVEIAIRCYAVRGCQLLEHLAHHASDREIKAMGLGGNLLTGQTACQQGEPDLRLGFALGVEGEHLFDGPLQDGAIGPVEVQRANPFRDAAEHLTGGEQDQFVLGFEIVAKRADGPSRFGCEGTNRYRAHAATQQYLPHGGRDLAPPFVVINHLRQRSLRFRKGLLPVGKI